MNIALVGKFDGQQWRAEYMVKRGFEALGHSVHAIELSTLSSPDAVRLRVNPGDLTVVMQGYGLERRAIEYGRMRTGYPWVLWHAEVMSPTWPHDDPVVRGKEEQLVQNIDAYDAVGHNCSCCLGTLKKLGARQVFWAPANGVDPTVHRRLDIPKRYDVGTYGWPSDRRMSWLRALKHEGIEVVYPQPQDGVYGEALMRFINECQVIVNVHYSESSNTECRVYESLGCGVPVVSDPISMPDLFPPEDGLLSVADPKAMAAAIRALTAHGGAEATRLGQRGYALVHGEFTYAQRCQMLLDVIECELALEGD